MRNVDESNYKNWDWAQGCHLSAGIAKLLSRLISCCGVTIEPLTPLLAGGHRPHETVKGSVRGGSQVEIHPNSLDHSQVCLRQLLNGRLVGKATGDVLPQESNDFTFFLAKVLGIHPFGSHDSQRERKTTRRHVISPWGGGGRDAG